MSELDAELALFQAEISALPEPAAAYDTAALPPPTAPPPATASHAAKAAPKRAPQTVIHAAVPPAHAAAPPIHKAAPPASTSGPSPLSPPPGGPPSSSKHAGSTDGQQSKPALTPPPAGPPMGVSPSAPMPPPMGGPPVMGFGGPPVGAPPIPPPPIMPGMYGGPTGMGEAFLPPLGMPAPGMMPPPAMLPPLSVAALKAQQQQQQAQRPVQHDAVAAATATGTAPVASPSGEKEKPKGKLMQAAGKRWRDPTLDEWPENDYRIFVGDMGNEVTDELLAKSFKHYASFAKAKIVRDHRTKKSKGFGFVSFLESADYAKALREMNGKYIGNRPCKLSKSSWTDRAVQKKGKKPKAG